MLSAHIRLSEDHHNTDSTFDYGHAIDEAAALGRKVSIWRSFICRRLTPAVLEPLAEAIRDSGLLTSKDNGR